MNQEGVIISLGHLGESCAATVHVWARFSCFFHILFTSRTLQNSLVESICSWNNQKRKKVRGKKREKKKEEEIKKKQAQRRKKVPFCQEEKKLVYESDWYWRSSSLPNKEVAVKPKFAMHDVKNEVFFCLQVPALVQNINQWQEEDK